MTPKSWQLSSVCRSRFGSICATGNRSGKRRLWSWWISISGSFSDSISGQEGDTMSKYDALWVWIRENRLSLRRNKAGKNFGCPGIWHHSSQRGNLRIGHRRSIFLKEKPQKLAGQENYCILCEGFPIWGKSISGNCRPEHDKKDPKDYEVWERALMAAGDDKCDWTDRKYLEPILAALKE